MNRRGFMGAILALGAAPAIVRADSLMRIIPRDTIIGMGDKAFTWVVDDGFLPVDWTVDYIAPAGRICKPAAYTQVVLGTVYSHETYGAKIVMRPGTAIGPGGIVIPVGKDA